MSENNTKNHRLRLREKYDKSGINAFLDYEKLELLLSFCIPYKDTKPLAKELISRFGSISGVFSAHKQELTGIKGINERTALFLRLIRDIGESIKHSELLEKGSIRNPSEIVDYYKLYFTHKKDEEFCVVYMNNQNRIIMLETLCKGTINRVDVYPRSLIDRILRLNAKNIIILHNHPGGSLSPSMDDNYLTFRLAIALRNIESSILDHIIICNDNYFSYSEEGIIADIYKKIDTIERDFF